MKKIRLLLPLLAISSLILPACNKKTEGTLEIELDEFTPQAYLGEEYDFTDVLYVQEGVDYKLDVYYQNYTTMEEFKLPVKDTFYFTPVELYDLTVIVNATKGNLTAKRTRHIQVSYNPEDATRYNLEVCNFEPGQWRGTGSKAELSYTDTFGANSKTSRKISFKYSLDQDMEELPATEAVNNDRTVNASFNLATTPGLGTDANIDAKENILSFDIKLSKEFYESNHLRKNCYSLKIEDNSWAFCKADYLNLVENPADFTMENTNNGWIHVEQNLYETSEFDSLGNGTYVMTFGFYGLTKETQDSAYVILDNIALNQIPADQMGVRETPTRNNIEMCHFEPGQWRGTGSKAVTSFTEVYGANSTSSRKVTFVNSEDLPDAVDSENNATVNASFNLAVTWSIGVDNEIDAKNSTLSFDIKLSEEFFNTTHPYKHMFSLKIEDGRWDTRYTWISFVNNPADFTMENTDNGWIHVSYDLSANEEITSEVAGKTMDNNTYVLTFGLFGITNTTRHTASAVFDNISLVANS